MHAGRGRTLAPCRGHGRGGTRCLLVDAEPFIARLFERRSAEMAPEKKDEANTFFKIAADLKKLDGYAVEPDEKQEEEEKRPRHRSWQWTLIKRSLIT